MAAWIFSNLTWLIALTISPAGAIPHPSSGSTPESAAVFLKPHSAIPTGHYNVDLLKRNIATQEKVRWVFLKDPASGLSGWTPKQNLLTPLHFSTKARLLAQSPIYREKKDRVPDTTLTPQKETLVDLLEIQNEWVLVSLNNHAVWTPIANLFSVDKDAGYFFLKTDQYLRQNPQAKTAFITRVSAGQRLRPVEAKGDWVKVSYNSTTGSLTGYVPLNEIVSRVDIAMKVKTDQGFERPRHGMITDKVFAIYVNPLWLGTAVNKVPVFSEPSASADLRGYLKPWQNLSQQDSVEQEWAVSKLPELGMVWWRKHDDSRSMLQLSKLARNEIKKIQQNPLFNHLRMASAKGLYRSTDGVYWAPIRGFQGYNPSFTYAKDGALFVEDQVSFDNGEHFTPYIYWENMFRALKEANLGVRGTVKINNIEALNNNSHQLILEIDVGNVRPFKMYTADRGQSWSLLKL